MKLRIKGNSMRLRVSPSEMKRLLSAGRIEEIALFSQAPGAKLTYALEQAEPKQEIGAATAGNCFARIFRPHAVFRQRKGRVCR